MGPKDSYIPSVRLSFEIGLKVMKNVRNITNFMNIIYNIKKGLINIYILVILATFLLVSIVDLIEFIFI